jgi:hypothetical protein
MCAAFQTPILTSSRNEAWRDCDEAEIWRNGSMIDLRHHAEVRQREHWRDAELVNRQAWMFEELRQRERQGMLWSVGRWLRDRGGFPIDPPGAGA